MVALNRFSRRAAAASVAVFCAHFCAPMGAGAQTPPAAAPAPEAQALSLQAFGANSAACLEWGDGCAICRRDEGGAAHCSTPGIACQPSPVVCAREQTK